MSDTCCDPPEAGPSFPICPVNGKAGKPVAWRTVAALTKCPLPPRQDLWLCPDPACTVVYFGAAGALLEGGDLTTEPGFKQGASDLVCYCFHHHRSAISLQLRETGTTTVLDAIRERAQAGDCACEVRNPTGKCCLGEIQRLIRSLADRPAS